MLKTEAQTVSSTSKQKMIKIPDSFIRDFFMIKNDNITYIFPNFELNNSNKNNERNIHIISSENANRKFWRSIINSSCN